MTKRPDYRNGFVACFNHKGNSPKDPIFLNKLLLRLWIKKTL